jgi:RND family efflux transporter MFP subunit
MQMKPGINKFIVYNAVTHTMKPAFINKYKNNGMKYNSQFTGISCLVLLLMACGDSKNPGVQQAPPPPVPVNVYTVAEGPAVYYDEYPATINPLNEVELHSQISGYITGIFFRDGDKVQKGQKLYTIDQQQYAGTYNQAVANLDVAKANLDKAQKNADRYQELDKNDAIAKQTVDNALADLQAAKMQVKAAEANVSAVQTNLRYAVIKAPFSGTIGISQVKMGSAVAPGATILNTISSNDPVAVDFAVDEKEIPRFAALLNKPGPATDSVFTLKLPDGSLYAHPAKIVLLDRAVDPQTGTIKTRLEIRNPGNILKPGITCNIRVKSSGQQTGILIPSKAVTEQMGEYFVYILGDSNKVAQQKIVAGKRINDKLVVREGLQPGQVIVTDGIQKVKPGAVVNPTKDSTAAPK